MAFSAAIARLWSPEKGATTEKKVNLDSPCSFTGFEEKDSEHLEHSLFWRTRVSLPPTFLLEDWLRKQRQAGDDDVHGKGSGNEGHLGELSTQEGDGGTGGPTQQSVGGVRLKDKQDSAVAIDAPGEISIGSGVDFFCSPVRRPSTLGEAMATKAADATTAASGGSRMGDGATRITPWRCGAVPVDVSGRDRGTGARSDSGGCRIISTSRTSGVLMAVLGLPAT